MEYRITDSALVLTLDADIYPQPVLFKCFYGYGDDYRVDIDPAPGSRFIVTLEPLEEYKEFPGFEALTDRVTEDLIRVCDPVGFDSELIS